YAWDSARNHNMLGNHMHGTTTSRILGGARLRRKHRDLPPLRPSLMLMLGADIPPAAPEQHKNLWTVASCGKANLPLPSVLSTSCEPTGFRLADVEEEPGRAPPADAPEPPRPRVGEAHVEIVDVFGGGEEPHGPTQHEDPRTQRDRKSTRLNSSHVSTSYAVFCL